jgi:uncharacterized protein
MEKSFLKEVSDGVQLAVKLQPRASRDQVQGVQGTELKISVTAPPVDFAANEALLQFLANELDCARRNVVLLRGQTSRHKTILVKGMALAHILQKLTP